MNFPKKVKTFPKGPNGRLSLFFRRHVHFEISFENTYTQYRRYRFMVSYICISFTHECLYQRKCLYTLIKYYHYRRTHAQRDGVLGIGMIIIKYNLPSCINCDIVVAVNGFIRTDLYDVIYFSSRNQVDFCFFPSIVLE